MKGKRTIVSAVVAIIAAAGAYWTGDADKAALLTVIKEAAFALTAVFLRIGMKNDSVEIRKALPPDDA